MVTITNNQEPPERPDEHDEENEELEKELNEWKKNNPPPQDPAITKVQSVGALPPQETLTKEDKDINTVVYRLGLSNHAISAQSIDDKLTKFGGYIKKDLPMLKQRMAVS